MSAGAMPQPRSCTEIRTAGLPCSWCRSPLLRLEAGIGDCDDLDAHGGELSLEAVDLAARPVVAAIMQHDRRLNPLADIETVLAQSPDIIVSIPTDPVATAATYKAADKGVKLVFMDNVPAGLVADKKYVSVYFRRQLWQRRSLSPSDGQGAGWQGRDRPHLHAVDFFVTRQRHDAFKKTIAENYPDIEIVAEEGIGGPNFSGEAQKAASAMLTAHGSIKGIWAVWAVPAEGVISAAGTTGRNDLVITTIDLGEECRHRHGA